jgi:fumarate reductase subunit D
VFLWRFFDAPVLITAVIDPCIVTVFGQMLILHICPTLATAYNTTPLALPVLCSASLSAIGMACIFQVTGDELAEQ